MSMNEAGMFGSDGLKAGNDAFFEVAQQLGKTDKGDTMELPETDRPYDIGIIDYAHAGTDPSGLDPWTRINEAGEIEEIPEVGEEQ